MTQTTSVFEALSAVQIKGKIERKGNLDYLSWANAWAMLKDIYPNSQRTVYDCEHSGLNFFTDGRTAYVKVGITVNGLEHIDYLPIMDNRNNSIPIEKVTSTDVNKTIQRSTAKAIAMHGLGLALWTGEDLPDITEAKKIAPSTAVLDDLKLNTPQWDKVVLYVNANQSLGYQKIEQQLARKYNVDASVKKAINNLITA